MADQIEQMGVVLENHQKVCLCDTNFLHNIHLLVAYFCDVSIHWAHISYCKQKLEDLQDKYNVQIRQCSDLSNKLGTTEVSCGYMLHMLLDFWVDFNCDGEKPHRKTWIKLAYCLLTPTKNSRNVSMLWRRRILLSRNKEKQVCSYSTLFEVLMISCVFILLLNLWNRKCTGSTSLCFTIWLGESSQGQFFIVFKNWYAVHKLVLSFKLFWLVTETAICYAFWCDTM